MYDIMQLAEDRQREIFTEMDATGMYIEPQELQDHKNMLEVAYTYVMTAEFKYLPKKTRDLIIRHIKEREELASQGAAGSAGAGAPPAEAPQGGAPAAPEAAGPANLGALLGLG
jgi:hypothetical protein